MKYYAIGERKTKVKDGQGKDQTVQQTIIITPTELSRPWDKRVVAQNEAEDYCKRNKITLQGVYIAKSSSDNGGVMSKGIKGQKAKAHRQQQLKRRASK